MLDLQLFRKLHWTLLKLFVVTFVNVQLNIFLLRQILDELLEDVHATI